MSDKSSRESFHQIVFLIDSSPSFWGSNYSAEHAAKAIRLCVLRLLTYFSDCWKEKRSSLRWGYKIFNSKSLSHQFERHDFKEFLVNAFEEFEDHVSKRLQESFAQQWQINELEPREQDDTKTTAFSKSPCGARCVSFAFKNAVHDFQWERPDISSPVRRTRGNNNSLFSHNNITNTHNVIFLLSGCPHDDEAISEFSGENLSCLGTIERFKSILMPSALYKEFKERRICLHWVNMGNFLQEENAGIKSFVEATVEQLGGCLIPLSAVIYTGNNFSIGSNLKPQSGKDVSVFKKVKSSMEQLLPFKTVMDFYFCKKLTKPSAPEGIISQQQAKAMMDGTGLLCSSGAEEKVHCTVKLNISPFLTLLGAEEKVHCTVKLHSIFQSMEGLKGLGNFHGNSSLTYETADVESKQTPSNDESSSVNLLWIRGVVNHTCVSPRWLHPTKGYSCIGLDNSAINGTIDSSFCSQNLISGWYQALILSLAKENKLLVIDFVDCDTGLPVTGVLQPLTSVCGVINVIASEFLVTFEKFLLWHGKSSPKDRTKLMNVESCQDLISSHGSQANLKSTESLSYPEVFFGLTGSQDPIRNKREEFNAVFFDPWGSFTVEENTTGSFLNELKRDSKSEEEEHHHADNEAALMKELKDLYNKKESHLISTTSIVTRLPKKLKKLAAERSEAQSASSKHKRNLRKETSADDQKSRLDINKSQPAIENDELNDCSTDNDSLLLNNSTAMQELPCNLKDEAELKMAICDLTSKVILEGENILHEMTNIVTIVSQFFVNEGDNEQKGLVSQFLEEHVLLTVSALKEKYEGCSDVIRQGQQVREYQLQIMLRLEIAVLISADGKSSLIEEVTVLLRAISFMKDPKFLTIFLREILLFRYGQKLAKFLCAVYEGLMMRPPREVFTSSKWSSDDESPIRRQINSVSSAKQDSNQPRSSGCRIITRHSSVSDAVGKRREIIVPGKAKPKDKEKEKALKGKPHVSLGLRVGSKKGKKKSEGQKTPVKQVRRNLFTESQEGHENNSVAKVPRKRNISEGEKKKRAKRRFQRRNTVGSCSNSTVQETPAHKQVSHALWRKQDRARKRSRAHTEVHILQESPLKELPAGEGLPRRSPRRPPLATFQRSQSFYGHSSSTSPLTRTRSFSGVYSRDSPKEGPTEGSAFISTQGAVVKKTPQKLSSSALSPLRFSPRQKKKFSLHSLLTTSKEHDQKKESPRSHQNPTTPKHKLPSTATRSSPRLLKKRSFSCIGFSSVLSPEAREKRKVIPFTEKFSLSKNTQPPQNYTFLDADSQSGLMKTPRKKKSDDVTDVRGTTPTSHGSSPRLIKQRFDSRVVVLSPEERKSKPLGARPRSGDNTNCTVSLKGSMKTPMKEKIDNFSDNEVTSSKSTLVQPEKRTPMKDYHVDECVVLLTPIRKSLKSPLHVPPEILENLSSCSPRLSHRDGEESTKLEGSVQDVDENVRTPARNRIKPALRSSPRMLCRRDSSDTSQQTSKQSLCNPEDFKPTVTVSLKSTRTDLTDPTTPVSVSHLDDCVVVLTPMRTLSKSPMHLRSGEKKVTVIGSDSENAKVASDAGIKSLQSSSQTTPKSAHDVAIEHRLRAKSPILDSKSTDIESQGAELFRYNKTLTNESEKRLNESTPTEGAERITRHTNFQEDEIFLRMPSPSVGGVQLPWNPALQSSTPPPKRRKKKSHGVSNSPVETKRLSPLNQILRQQKRKRCFSASPADKCAREACEIYARDASSCAPRTHFKKGNKVKLSLVNESCSVVEDKTRLSEEADDWLKEMEEELDRCVANSNETRKSPAIKKRRIHKSVVFGGKRTREEGVKKTRSINVDCSQNTDTSYEEDDEVFQSPGMLASRLIRRHLNKTPISVSSIKVLQESPILLDSNHSPALSPRTRSCSNLSPNYSKRNCRKLVDVSTNREARMLVSYTDDQEEPIARPLRKRLKLHT